MNEPSPAMHVRRALSVTLAMLLLVMSAATAAADPQPGATMLTASVDVRDDASAVVAGTLSDHAGTPVPNARIRASVHGEQQAEGTTDDDGAYLITFMLPEALRGEPQQLVAVFDGGGGLDASQATAPVQTVGESAPPPATPPDERINVLMGATTASSSVSAGGLVIIEGTLTDQAGAPVSGVRIRVMLDDEESSDSLALTDDAGAFKTFAEVPADHPAGVASLVVSFAGDNVRKAGSQEIDLAVERIPVADQPSSEASSSVADDATASSSANATMSTADDVNNKDTESMMQRGPMTWFYVALIVVGGAATLVTAGLVFKTMYGRRTEKSSRNAGGLDMLLEQDPELDDEETGLFTESFGDEAPEDADRDAETGEVAPPRRGPD